MRPRLLVAACLALASSAAMADHFRFVVAGDGRSQGNPSKRAEDEDGVNMRITGEIARATVKEHAKFLLWTGDLVYGQFTGKGAYEGMLRTWLRAMKPAYDAHIPILPCRGNHEAGSTDGVDGWNDVFSGPLALPRNGPPAERNLTFWKTFGSVLVIGLDQFEAVKDETAVDQAWLNGVLKKHRRPFVFAFAHEAAFKDSEHKDLMDDDPPRRDAFWESLIRAGSRVFFCGHDHIYDRMAVTREGARPGPTMFQIVAGTAGAPFYKREPYNGNNKGWNLVRVKDITDTYGYLVVDIDGNKATITFKARTAPGVYKPMDSFSYTVPGSK